jgi:hypothetical protein
VRVISKYESDKKTAKRAPQHRKARVTATAAGDGINELAKTWRLLSAACLDDETKQVQNSILSNPAVGKWVMQAKPTDQDKSEAVHFVDRAANRFADARPEAAERLRETMPLYALELARDKRATALVTIVVAFQRTARLQWKTPEASRERYLKLAESLRELAETMRQDIVPGIRRHAGYLKSAASDVDAFANFAQDTEWAKSWTHSRPANAAAIDFARSLQRWLKEVAGCQTHNALTSVITNMVFEEAQMTPAKVQRLTR